MNNSFSFEQCPKIQKQIDQLLENVRDIYINEIPKVKEEKIKEISLTSDLKLIDTKI
jgi:hypothetical protein